MSLQRPRHKRMRLLAQAVWPVALALGLSACANPPQLTPGALVASGKRATPWEAEVAARSDAARRLSEGEGEVVVANAVAAHERRRP
jgi:hypothetical protein